MGNIADVSYMAIDFSQFSRLTNTALVKLRSGLEVDFPPNVYFERDSLKTAADRRAAVLFNDEKVADTVYRPPKSEEETDEELLYGRKKPELGAVFDFKPSAFLKKARECAPEEPQPTASGLAAWVYSLYSSALGDDDDKERGKKLEQEVFDRRLRAAGCTDNAYLKNVGSPWRLIHNGLHLQDQKEIICYQVPSLLIGGKPMRVSPDLVYRNRESGEVFIVEIKNTWMNVPSNLWPNIWAQLWVYAQIPEVLAAPKVTVVGEVWGERFSRKQKMVSLRACVKRDPRQPKFDRFFRELFKIYSGGSLSPRLPYRRQR
ncbi:hypothetical protein [Sphingobium sp. DN12]|uniref:hypothetical protein n=1 Tax=Sphingobium sp. DN12 TaxID=3378073 RepID=UPI003DA314E5